MARSRRVRADRLGRQVVLALGSGNGGIACNGAAASSGPVKSAAWDCKACGFHNFGFRSNCKRCELAKGTPPPPKGKPPSSAIPIAEVKVSAGGKGKGKSVGKRSWVDVAKARSVATVDDKAGASDRAGPVRGTSSAHAAGGQTEAQKLVHSLQIQIGMVKKLVEVATGEHLAYQQVAQAGLETQLEVARSQVRDGKDPAQRRKELESSRAALESKLTRNRALLQEAEAKADQYRSYAASQSAKLAGVQSELDSLAVSAPSGSDGIVDMERQLHELQCKIANAKAAARPGQIPATVPGAVGTAPFGATIAPSVVALGALPAAACADNPGPGHSLAHLIMPEDHTASAGRRGARSLSPGRSKPLSTQRRLLFGA